MTIDWNKLIAEILDEQVRIDGWPIPVGKTNIRQFKNAQMRPLDIDKKEKI
jgi:hypothetical protein